MASASSSACSQNGAFSRLLLLISQCLFSIFLLASSTPPADPVKCASKNTNCTITNSYGTFPDRSTCRAASVAYPTTESELISAVASAAISKTKVKVATSSSGSIPKLVCTDGEDGVIISTKYLNRTLAVDRTAMTITVESGMTLKQLISDAAEADMALPYTPYWWALTVGGMLGTGAHGSTLWGDHGSSVHDYVKEMRLVSPGEAGDRFFKVRVLSRESNPEEFEAAKVSLGVLGVISQVTFQLQPMFKRSLTYVRRDDSNLAEEAVSFGKKHEFADMLWYPSRRRVIYRMDDRVSLDVKGDGLYDFIPFRSQSSAVLSLVRSKEEFQEARMDSLGKCLNAYAVNWFLFDLNAFGLTDNGNMVTDYQAVGNQSRIQASGACLNGPQDNLRTACPWDPKVNGLFFFQVAFTVPLTSVTNFILDVQKLIQLEPRSLCGVELYNGILMRYVTGSSAFLGKEVDGIDFDITFYRSKDPMTPRLFEDILEEIEQMAFFKYKALTHWGKNRNLAFEGAIKKYKNAAKFLKVKETFDLHGLFSSQWTDQILGLEDGITIYKNGCALEGLCVCKEDIHCAPDKGYFCRPGKVYKEARVCTKENNMVVSM